MAQIAKLRNVKYFYIVPEKPKSWAELARQGGRFGIVHPFCRKLSKNEWGPFCGEIFFSKKRHNNAEKNENGTLFEFSIFLSQNIKNIERGTL